MITPELIDEAAQQAVLDGPPRPQVQVDIEMGPP